MLSSFNSLVVKTKKAFEEKDYAILIGVAALVLFSITLILRNPITVTAISIILFLLSDEENSIKALLNKHLSKFGVGDGEEVETTVELPATDVMCEISEEASDDKEPTLDENDPIPVANA